MRTEAADPPHRQIGQIRSVPKRLPRFRLGKMHLDEWNRNGRQRIAQRDGCMRKCGRVDDDAVNRLRMRRLDPVDQLMLGIGLKEIHLDIRRLRLIGQLPIDFSQRLTAIDVRLAHTKQVQIRAV